MMIKYLAQTNIGQAYQAPIGAPGSGVGVAPGSIVTTLIQASITLAGTILLFAIVFAGFNMVKGAGENNPEAMAKGKKALTYAVIGFIIVFTAFWIVQIVETISGQQLLV